MLKMMMMMLLMLMMLISVLQIFEWWYFRKYGTSFIEQVSVSHLRPLLGGVDNSTPNSSSSSSSSGDTESSRQSVSGQNLGRTPAILALNGSGHDSDLGPWNLEPWTLIQSVCLHELQTACLVGRGYYTNSAHQRVIGRLGFSGPDSKARVVLIWLDRPVFESAFCRFYFQWTVENKLSGWFRVALLNQ